MRKKILGIICVIMVIILTASVTVFICFLKSENLCRLKDLYIETAMTTFKHQWLATKLFSPDEITEVMERQVTTLDLSKSQISSSSEDSGLFNSKIFWDYADKKEGDTDDAGNKIFKVDTEQEIAIVNISGSDYKGKLAIIQDPSRVRIRTTTAKNKTGLSITSYMSKFNAVLAVNASAFADYNGVGGGGDVMGLTCENGEKWGNYDDTFNTIALDEHDKLIVGKIKEDEWEDYEIRDAAQFNPAIVADGEKQIEGTAGWGLQPRTIIGQREDGAILLMVIDGRKPGYSVGATLEQCADEMLKYDVVTAAGCDGGSSAIMGYNGNVITRCSSPQSGGRYLPNAFVVDKIER